MLEPLEAMNAAHIHGYFQSLDQLRAGSLITLTSIGVILSRLDFLKSSPNKPEKP